MEVSTLKSTTYLMAEDINFMIDNCRNEHPAADGGGGRSGGFGGGNRFAALGNSAAATSNQGGLPRSSSSSSKIPTEPKLHSTSSDPWVSSKLPLHLSNVCFSPSPNVASQQDQGGSAPPHGRGASSSDPSLSRCPPGACPREA